MARDRRAGPNITALTVAQGEEHPRKAEEYLRSAQAALERGDLDAAGGNAVLAGINAADGVSGLLQGSRWDGAHEQAAAHVQTAGADRLGCDPEVLDCELPAQRAIHSQVRGQTRCQSFQTGS